MNSFRSDRRELLRIGALGLGAAVGSALPEAHASPTDAAPASVTGLFDIRNYGAIGNGKAIDSPAINKAIEAAAAAGGGTVVFPGG
jgi:polygalacturonase